MCPSPPFLQVLVGGPTNPQAAIQEREGRGSIQYAFSPTSLHGRRLLTRYREGKTREAESAPARAVVHIIR